MVRQLRNGGAAQSGPGKPDKPPGKPDRPGKPVETWNLDIWIGTGEEDIVLINPPLSAEDVPCSV